MQVYTHAYTLIHTYMHKHIHVQIGVYTYISTYIHTQLHTYLHTCIHIVIHTYIRTYIQTCINPYIYVSYFRKLLKEYTDGNLHWYQKQTIPWPRNHDYELVHSLVWNRNIPKTFISHCLSSVLTLDDLDRTPECFLVYELGDVILNLRRMRAANDEKLLDSCEAKRDMNMCLQDHASSLFSANHTCLCYLVGGVCIIAEILWWCVHDVYIILGRHARKSLVTCCKSCMRHCESDADTCYVWFKWKNSARMSYTCLLSCHRQGIIFVLLPWNCF